MDLLVRDSPDLELIEPDSGPGAAKPATRWWLVAGFALALAGFVPDAFGRQVFDTKINLTVDPSTFLHNLIYLWDPSSWFGVIRNQYQGYAFPTIPFFLLGHLLAIPAWLVQRAWMALLVSAAFWGAVRLAEALDIGTPTTRLVAGAAFALWPTFTILVGSVSASVAPGVLLPWVLIPLVRGCRGGSPMRAAAYSGVAVLFMGGVNAAVTLYSLVLPAIYLLTRTQSRRRRSLMGWWVVCVGLATAWWVIPLLFLGKYGFNFLPYVEQSISTTSTSSATTSLAGTGDWTAYLNIGNVSATPAGFSIAFLPVALIASAVAAAAGLYGLARRDIPERRFLIASLALLCAAAMAAYWGQVGGPFSFVLRPLLDGALAPFRNVYKLEPSIALILVLGIAHSLNRIPRRIPRGAWHAVAAIGAVAVLASLATPYLLGRVVEGHSFTAIPNYWYKTADYLKKNSPETTALVMPASSHGEYVWGWTEDEPLEALARSPWADDQNPAFAAPGNTRMIDAIELALKTGLPAPGLPALLSRSGIKYIVLQNDVQWQLSDSPSPLQVHQVLTASGFTRVAKFGPKIETATTNYPTLSLSNEGPKVAYHAVEIFEARSAQAAHPLAPVATFPVSTTALVSGGPEAVLQLLNQGVIAAGQGVVLAGDSSTHYSGPLFAITDTLRRENTNFGETNDNTSYTYTATEETPALALNPATPAAPSQLLPFSGTQHETVAVLSGAKSISASSYGSYWFSFPEYDPANVFDGQSTSGWVAGNPFTSVGEWVQIQFDHPVDPKGSLIQPLVATGRPTPTEVRVTTNRGSAVTRLHSNGRTQPLRVPPGKASYLRVTIEAVKAASGAPITGAGIESISIPGVHVGLYLKPSEESLGQGARQLTYSFATAQVDPTDILRSPPEPTMARVFSTPRKMEGEVTGQALPSAVPLLFQLLGSSPLTITATSTLGDLPLFRPQNLVDGDPSTSWVADGVHATVTMNWPKPRVLTSLTVDDTNGDVASPEEVLISSPFGNRLLHLGGGLDNTVKFAPLDTNSVVVSFPKLNERKIRNLLGNLVLAPVGLSELDFPALLSYQIPQPNPAKAFSEPCGSGPPIDIDGTKYKTSLHGTYANLLSLDPLTLTMCTAYGTVPFDAGSHHLIAPITKTPFVVSALTIKQVVAVPASNDVARTARVVNWGAESRKVAIGAGSATYLEVHQNYNAGWTATLNGKSLTPVELDGWQQGYVVPAGKGGVVQLKFGPERLYLIGLLIGALGVLLLLLLALGVMLRRRGETLEPCLSWRAEIPLWLSLVAAGGVMFVVGGPMVLAVPILALLGSRRPTWLPWLAALGMTAAGVIAAFNPGTGALSRAGSFSAAAQICALIALAAVLVPLVTKRNRKLRRHHA